MKTSQAWSMDIMIAVVIFIGAIFVFYSILNEKQGDKTSELEDDASIVLKNIASEDSSIRVVDGVEIDIAKLEDLLNMPYSEIKKKIRIKNEFCIFLEDEDGNIIYIEDPTDPTKTYSGVGSGKVKISGDKCNPACNDGIDNDDDDKIDLLDPGCVSNLDDDESG